MVDPDVLCAVRAEVMSRLAGVFGRRESRQHAGDYLRGLLSDLPRKMGGRSRSTPDVPDRMVFSACSTRTNG